MMYKIVIITREKSTAEKIRTLIQKSAVYNSEEFVNLNPITEVCDECAKRN